jgi:hypothetical protein
MPKLLLAFTAIAVAVTVIFWWRGYSQQPESSLNTAQATPTPVMQRAEALPDEYSQLSLRDRPRKEVIREFNQNTKRDSRYEWKIPIRFYGKVLDQNNNPIDNASVHFQWVNLRGSEGVEEADTITDTHGRFSLEGKRGKNLGVRISKEGYYDVSPYENQLDFEYANPAENTFYEPDASNPVIFLMRRKGKMEALIAKEVELELSGQGTTGTVDLSTGGVSPSGGQLQVTVWKPTITTEQINAGKVFPYDWRLQIRINHGGLAEQKDVFPFEAPESGYVAQYDATFHPTNGASADVAVDKQFYFHFGRPPKYGRLRVRTAGDRPYVSIDYWLNPSGSRNLEYEASKDEDDS